MNFLLLSRLTRNNLFLRITFTRNSRCIKLTTHR